MADQLIDALGIPLADHTKWLPDRVALWPTPRKLVNKEAAACWRRSWFQCWYCGVITDSGETSPRRGCLGDWRRAAEVLFERESLPWDTPPRREAGERASRCIARGAHPGSHNGQDDCKDGRLIAHALSSEGADASEDGTGRGTPIVVSAHDTGQGWWNQSDISGTLRAEGDNRPSRPSNIIAYQQHGSDVGQMACLRSERGDVQSGVPFTIYSHNGGAKRRHAKEAQVSAGVDPHGAFSHGQGGTVATGSFGVRRLTTVECARLQGFPDSWLDCGLSDSAKYRALGNAVCVPVAEWIGKRIMQATEPGE